MRLRHNVFVVSGLLSTRLNAIHSKKGSDMSRIHNTKCVLLHEFAHTSLFVYGKLGKPTTEVGSLRV